MKKLLSVAFCAAAALSFAAEVKIADVGVTKVSIPAGQKNTIIAASFNNLSDVNAAVQIANLVKTTGLKAGDELRLYKDGKYSVWTLNADDGQWVAPTTVTTEGTEKGADPATTDASVGDGLWFIRKNAEDAASVVLYGSYKTGSKIMTVTANAWNLIGNPTFTNYEFKTGTKGDKIRKVVNGDVREYIRKSSAWKYQTFSDGVLKWVTENPTVAPGEGIWYNPVSATSVTWAEVPNT